MEKMSENLESAKNTKASVIDLGSNSVKMTNYNVDSHISYKPYHQESVRVKLAEGKDGIISDDRAEKTLETLKLFRNIVDFEQIDYVIAVATSAVRDASNKDDFIGRIRLETGFDFKVLSEHEEALYSYAGAIRSLNLPSVVFFDIGGGSLEIVYSKNFEIQSVLSLPLGSLRLTQQFSTGSDFSEADISNMRSYIRKCLPSRESLGLSGSDAVMVGVGGALRALAKYEQAYDHYPLTKLHNYSMSCESLELLSQYFLSRTTQEITKIESMGTGRAYTVQAGSMVISELVNLLGFQSLVVSAHGLREGTLSLSLQYPDDFTAHKIDAEHVQDLIHISCQPEPVSEYVGDIVNLLFVMELITDKERILLAHATAQIDKLSSFRDVDNVLYMILDDDSLLSHREQLVVALSLIYSKKKKKAEALIARFEKILKQSDRKSIKKISSVVSLCDIFHKTRTLVKPKSEGSSSLSLDVYASKNTFPEVLLQQVCSRMENVLGIAIKSKIYYGQSGYTPQGPQEIP